MKLFSIFKKLPLITLLSLGLACSPLVASADDSDRGRHGHYQQDHGKSHHRNDHRRDHRDRHSYRKGYKHGHRNARYHNKRHGHHGRYYNSHKRYGHGHHYDRHHGHHYAHVGFMLGLYSDNLDVIFRD